MESYGSFICVCIYIIISFERSIYFVCFHLQTKKELALTVKIAKPVTAGDFIVYVLFVGWKSFSLGGRFFAS